MSSRPVSPFRKVWYKWKALHLPWRKRFLVGLDLQGNTFWEFRDTLSSHKHRMRRIVQYPPSVQYSDLNISPQWHQWLRHTRQHPPSLTEQSQDLVRQENLKVLAAQADARWAAKSSVLDGPGREPRQTLPATQAKSPGEHVPLTASAGSEGMSSGVGGDLKGEMQAIDTKVGNAIEGKKGEDGLKMQVPEGTRHHSIEQATERKREEKEQTEDPWKHARGGPSEEWQPKSWGGNIAVKR